MSQLVVNSRVKADGSITLTLPPDVAVAGEEVRVTVQPMPQQMTQQEWQAWVQRMAGSWEGELERPSQGEYEVREPLS
jgi:hypothetical protein